MAALVIWWTGWAWVDPLASVLIGIIILLGSWRVLRPTLHLLMEDVPDGMDLAEIGASLADTPVVREVHDLHIWSLCAGHVVLTAHIWWKTAHSSGVIPAGGSSSSTTRMQCHDAAVKLGNQMLTQRLHE